VRDSTDNSEIIERISNLQRKGMEIEQNTVNNDPIIDDTLFSPTSPDRKLAQQVEYLKDP
jgi:hypothetical protein